MTIKRKLDGAVDESSVDQDFRKLGTTVHKLWKIWRPARSGTGSYGRQSGSPAGQQFGRRTLGEAWIFKSLLKIRMLDFPLCLAEVLHCFSNLMHL